MIIFRLELCCLRVVYVVYMLFICCLHVIYMLFICCLHVVLMLYTRCLHLFSTCRSRRVSHKLPVVLLKLCTYIETTEVSNPSIVLTVDQHFRKSRAFLRGNKNVNLNGFRDIPTLCRILSSISRISETLQGANG